ncbi:alpha/beta fold hydrolase [Brevibacillus sp. SYSU BS000544]|uniref:alpha/beta fold hydrolase n=1 Tax=Brevibacillus sp. SYSU BS000544 TaxID=3416443 RepID=UPI003CE4CA12
MEPIYYEIYGEGKPLVIFHPLATDHRAMKGWMEPIFEQVTGWQRIYVDLPAHGKSGLGLDVTTSDDFVAIFVEFLESLLGKTRRFSLVGQSFGGYIAQGIFSKMKEQVDGLCLLAPAIHIKDRTLPERVILEKDEDLLCDIDSDVATAFDTLMVVQNKRNLVAFLADIQPGRELANRVFLAGEWRKNGYFFSQEPFGEDEVFGNPALFLLGRQDWICGYEDQRKLLNYFPHATYAVLDQAGHMLQIEKRKLVQSLFVEWLESIKHTSTPIS